jgi:hypothetical protein
MDGTGEPLALDKSDAPDRSRHPFAGGLIMPRPFDPTLPAAGIVAPGPAAACCADGGSQASEPKRKRGGRLPAIFAVLLAFLASQHHTIMMSLLAFGLTDAAMSFMTAAPAVRDGMLGMSLVMIGVVGWQIKDSRRPRSMRVTGAVSIAATLGLMAWSLMHFGL